MPGFDAKPSTPVAEPMAIVGMACRWPGANSPEEFTSLLLEGRSGRGPVPSAYWNVDGFHHPNKERPGSIPVKEGFYLSKDPRNFDAAFFGINPTEATTMDPQQRQVLEVAYEALEAAGVGLEELAGSNTGVFVGNFTFEHSLQRFRDPDFNTAVNYNSTGHFLTLISNRISHVLNINGPSFTIDTACSSSLYALHQACNSLQVGDCSAAIVAGVNLMFGPDLTMDSSKLGVISPTAQCHTFDASADGYAKAEGVGALYVKKLSDAIRDGDPIRAVIRGTAVNANGRTPGITHPNPVQQEAVIRKAYQRAGIKDFSETSYFECHGTGTPTGDPLEVQALSRVFASGREPERPLLIGSVKTNLGHSEAASGLAGIIKAVLTLETKMIPPTIKVKKFNPKIDFKGGRVKVVTELTPLPIYGVARVSVNSFGFGGANAHAILETPENYLSGVQTLSGSQRIPTYIEGPFSNGPANDSSNGHRDGYGNGYSNGHNSGYSHGTNKSNGHSNGHSRDYSHSTNGSNGHSNGQGNGFSKGNGVNRHNTSVDRRSLLLTFSANDSSSLKENIAAIAEVAPAYEPKDLAYTLTTRRSKLNRRAFSVLEGKKFETAFANPLTGKVGASPRIAFIFTGQGAQHPRMGAELFEEFPVFSRTIRDLDGYLRSLPDAPEWSIEECLLAPPESSKVVAAEFSQPLCTALQVGLVDLLSSWGIKPVSTVGHSSGEMAGAYAAGLLSAREAIVLAYYRGLVAKAASTDGAMCAVGLGPHEIGPYLERISGITVGCVNSPQSLTISGDRLGVEQLQKELSAESKFARILKTDGKAYHSHHMKLVGELYETLAARGLSGWRDDTPRDRSAIMISSVLQKPLRDVDTLPIQYWRDNLESSVQFMGAVEKLADFNVDGLIEIGPHHALEGPLRHIRQNMGTRAPSWYIGTLARGSGPIKRMLELAGQVFLKGYPLNLTAVNSFDTATNKNSPSYQPKVIVNLPRYQWNHEKYLYTESRLNYQHKFRKLPRHDILGTRLPYGSGAENMWRNIIRVKDLPWLEDHQIQNRVVFPAAGYMAMAIEAITQVHVPKSDERSLSLSFKLRNVAFSAALVVEDTGSEVLLTLNAFDAAEHQNSGSTWYEFRILSTSSTPSENESWTRHCTGQIKIEKLPSGVRSEKPTNGDSLRSTSTADFYDRCNTIGLCYGPAFQGLKSISYDEENRAMVGTTSLEPTADSMSNESRYAVHPATLDTGFQAGAYAMTTGNLKALTAQLPVLVEELIVQSQPGNSPEADVVGTWRQLGLRSGFGNFSFHTKNLQVECKGFHTIAFESSLSEGTVADEEANPYLRFVWKPDVEKIQGSLDIDRFAADILPLNEDDHVKQELLALVDLHAHKVAGSNILQVGNEEMFPKLMELLGSKTSFRRYRKYVLSGGSFDVSAYNGTSHAEAVSSIPESDIFHVLLLSEISGEGAILLKQLRQRMIPTSSVIVPKPLWAQHFVELDLGEAQLRVHFETEHHLVLRATYDAAPSAEHKIIFVHHDIQSATEAPLSSALEKVVQQRGWEVMHSDLRTIGTQETDNRTVVVVLADVEASTSVLETVDEKELQGMQFITAKFDWVIWVTAGDVTRGSRPATGLISGLARTFNLEEPRLQFHTFDLETADANPGSASKVLCEHIESAFFSPPSVDTGALQDREYAYKEGQVYVCRAYADNVENQIYRDLTTDGAAEATAEIPKQFVSRKIGGSSLRMSIAQAGQPESIFFREDQDALAPLDADAVELVVKATGVNRRDILTMSGNLERKVTEGRPPFALSFERSGVVKRVGSNVLSFAPGDLVVSVGPGSYGTVERLPAYAYQKLPSGLSVEQSVTMYSAYATAIFTLKNIARLRIGEKVLILQGASDVGIAAISLAKVIGATVYTTVQSESERSFLKERLRLTSRNIFNVTNDFSLESQVKRATQNQGVDVVLTSHGTESTHDAWSCLASYGRFVDIGHRAHRAGVRLDASGFESGSSYTVFDLEKLFWDRPVAFKRLLEEVTGLYQAELIDPIETVSITDVSQLAATLRQQMTSPPAGKAVISYSDDNSAVLCTRTLNPEQHRVQFNPEATYLLIGGLGGLGRSLLMWMVSRGARYFISMSRSGANTESARAAVKQLEDAGADVLIVKGDVSKKEDISNAISTAKKPIKGMIHAAMVLRDGLFSSSTAANFHTVVNPKLVGCQHLHEQLHDLDFFLMMSSISGAIGTISQGNYAAANAALDLLARHRHEQGLPAASVALGGVSEVGYVAEHKDIEDRLARNGFYPITERDYLLAIETGIRRQVHQYPREPALNADLSGSSYLLTGLEPTALKRMMAKGFDGGSYIKSDPRFSVLENALTAESASANSGAQEKGVVQVARKFAEAGRTEAISLLLQLFLGKLSSLLLTAVEDFDVGRSVTDNGLDSMIGSEVRIWLYRELGCDMSFLELSAPGVTISKLIETIFSRLGLE